MWFKAPPWCLDWFLPLGYVLDAWFPPFWEELLPNPQYGFPHYLHYNFLHKFLQLHRSMCRRNNHFFLNEMVSYQSHGLLASLLAFKARWLWLWYSLLAFKLENSSLEFNFFFGLWIWLGQSSSRSKTLLLHLNWWWRVVCLSRSLLPHFPSIRLKIGEVKTTHTNRHESNLCPTKHCDLL